MDFSFIDDKRWLDLDQDQKDQMLDISFDREIAEDQRFGNLDQDTQQQMKNTYKDQAESYSQQTHAAPERGIVGDVVSNIARGITDLTELTGYGLKTLDPEGGINLGDRLGQKLIDLSEKAQKYDIVRPDVSEVAGEGFVKRGILGGLRSAVPSVAPVATGAGVGFLVGGPIGAFVGGTTATLGLFGLGTYGQKRDEYKAKGIDDKEAHKAALQHALVEGGIEEVSNVIGALTFGFGKLATQPLKQTAKELLRTPMKTFAKNLAKNTVFNELPTELIQSSLGAKIDSRLGLLPEDAWQEAAVEAIIPTLTMSVLFGTGAQGLTSMQRNRVKNNLNSENQSERIEASRFIAKRIDDKELQDAWIAMTSTNITENQPIDITADFSAFKFPEKKAEPTKVEKPTEIITAETTDEAIEEFESGIEQSLISKESEEVEDFLTDFQRRNIIPSQIEVAKPTVETKGFAGEVSKRVRPSSLVIPSVPPKMPVTPKEVELPFKKEPIKVEEIKEKQQIKKDIADKKFIAPELLRKYPDVISEEKILDKKPEKIVKEKESVKEEKIEEEVKVEKPEIALLRADKTIAQTMVDDFNKANPDAKLKFDGVTEMPEIMKDKPDQIQITPQKGSVAEGKTFVVRANELTTEKIQEKYNEKVKDAEIDISAKEKVQVLKDVKAKKFVDAKVLRKYPEVVKSKDVLDKKPIKVSPKEKVEKLKKAKEEKITKAPSQSVQVVNQIESVSRLKVMKKKVKDDKELVKAIDARIETIEKEKPVEPKLTAEDKVEIDAEEKEFSKKQLIKINKRLKEIDSELKKPKISLEKTDELNIEQEELLDQLEAHKEKKPDIDFQIDQLPGQGITLADIQKRFPKQFVSINPEGKITVIFQNKQGITIENVKKIDEESFNLAFKMGLMPDPEADYRILGKTEDFDIQLDKDYANDDTLIHESKHVLDNLGIITKKDNQILSKEMIRLIKKGQYNYDRSTHKVKEKALRDDLANTFTQVILEREKYRNTNIGKIIQKVLDFFDAIWYIGRMSTGKLAREFENGKIFARKPSEVIDQIPDFQVLGEQSNDVFSIPEASTKLEDFEYNIIDMLAPVSKVYKAIKGEINEKEDFILKERLRFNRTAAGVKTANEEIFEPIKKEMAKQDLNVEQVDEALYSRHVPEANKRLKRTNAKRFLLDLAKLKQDKKLDKEIAKLDKEFKKAKTPSNELQDKFLDLLNYAFENIEGKKQEALKKEWNEKSQKFSGMITDKAKEIYSKWSDNKAMQNIISLHDQMIQKTLDISLKSGRISKSEHKSLSETFDYYTPLYREGFVPKKGFDETGYGLVNLRKDYKIRGGSTKKAVNMLGNAMIQHEQSIIRAEKARAARAFINLVKNNPNKDFWNIEQKQLVNAYDHQGNIIKKEETAIAANEVPLKIDGKYYVVWFNPENEHGLRIVEHLKGNNDKSGPIINALGKFNRVLSMVNTSLNPEFILTNFPRDLQIAAVNIESTKAAEARSQIIKDLPKAIAGLRNYLRGDGKSDWGKIAKQFEASGAMMDWVDFTKDVDSRVNKLNKDVELYQGKRVPEKVIKNLAKIVMDYNTIAENAIRLSAYKNAKELGLSNDKAALLAKELTVNFGQRGKYGQFINSLYLFSNAGIQGSVRLLKGLHKSKRAKKIIGGMILTASGMAIANGLISGEDDEGKNYYEGIRASDKERNMIIMMPDTGKAIKIPLGWGLNFFWNIGTEIGDAILYGTGKRSKYDPMEGAMRLVNSAMNAFNPLQSATLAQSIAPTIVDPIVQVAENKTFFGTPLMPEKNPYEKIQTPESERYWKSVRPTSKGMTRWMNDITGGDKIEKGLVDVSPEVLDLIFDTFTGGMGRFYSDLFALPGKALGEKPIETRDIPLVRKAISTQDVYKDQKEFYDNIEHVYLLNAKIKEYPKKAKKIKKDKTYILLNETKKAEKRLKLLRKRLKRTKNKKMKIYIEKQIKKIQNDFNDRFYLMKKR